MQEPLSIKHNHSAIKHQRPGALVVNQCGFLKNSPEDLTYKVEYGKIRVNFLNHLVSSQINVTEFKEIEKIQPNFIKQQLYNPMCNLVCNFLNNHVSSNKIHAQHFFTFLTGTTEYYKIIVDENKIQIYEFLTASPVTSLYADIRGDSYVDVSFSNNWVISMRLHTAAKKIKGISLKFDSQLLTAMNKPIEIINL